MTRARTAQLAITFTGMIAGAALFVLAPFPVLANGALAFLIFVATGAAANLASGRLAGFAEKIADLRERVDHPPS